MDLQGCFRGRGKLIRGSRVFCACCLWQALLMSPADLAENGYPTDADGFAAAKQARATKEMAWAG